VQILNDSESGSDVVVEADGKSDLGEGGRHGRLIGANRQKLKDAALTKEVTLGREVKGMKEAMQKAAAQSSANFQQLLDIQLLDRMEEGAEKVQLWKAITKERKPRIKKGTQQLALELTPNTQLSSTNSAVTDTTSQQSKGIRCVELGTREGAPGQKELVDAKGDSEIGDTAVGDDIPFVVFKHISEVSFIFLRLCRTI